MHPFDPWPACCVGASVASVVMEQGSSLPSTWRTYGIPNMPGVPADVARERAARYAKQQAGQRLGGGGGGSARAPAAASLRSARTPAARAAAADRDRATAATAERAAGGRRAAERAAAADSVADADNRAAAARRAADRAEGLPTPASAVKPLLERERERAPAGGPEHSHGPEEAGHAPVEAGAGGCDWRELDMSVRSTAFACASAAILFTAFACASAAILSKYASFTRGACRCSGSRSNCRCWRLTRLCGRFVWRWSAFWGRGRQALRGSRVS